MCVSGSWVAMIANPENCLFMCLSVIPLMYMMLQCNRAPVNLDPELTKQSTFE